MLFLVLLATIFFAGKSLAATPVWLTLPATPTLPGSVDNAKVDINGVKLWWGNYGGTVGSSDKLPVVFIHGGLGYSAYFGDVIKLLMPNRTVIAVDRRGHGRSTMNDVPFTFDMFASDTHDLLSELGITKAAWVGWSDGAATTLAALMNTTIASTIDRAFVFAGFHDVSSTNSSWPSTDMYSTFVSRCQTEYATLQPDGNFTKFGIAVATLENSQPTWTASDLAKITLGSKVTIAGAQYDEAVNLDEAEILNGMVKGSRLVTLTNVSHFAPVQDPQQFAEQVEVFLDL
ncbi:MAG: hypothetical protein M1834_005624 [Cirrosporium novae-zelandiae]|nr:MAG: hypothetical protein M1834_005624 [Cirrosporium novae-zelandiae]